ncbi:PASTA domain-containing protein [Paraconexibacter antarcticus]|uniref:PASTA domain-containing protein n=1 Tax=Paraconexibacter antarcticus TaxID=2949664 RepID=A0ABY5DLL6_9ACTN|nr:PASTA domain-containing protein [Paraconexibacter antarcticus]UTI62735.1 PASTA domain-containing protein [Paraconexibacter antarcticus]
MHDEHTRIDPAGPAARWRPSRLTVALAAAAGFLAGVLLVAALGGSSTVTKESRVTVTRQVPATIPAGATVITVTRVPALVGERLDTAKDRLGEAKFDVDVNGGGLFGVLKDSNWEVVAQSPAAGTSLRQGSTVHVDIERR